MFAERLRPCSWKHDRSRGTTRPIESQPWAFGKLRCQTRVVNKHTNRHYQGASERHILFKIIMNICCFLTPIHSGWLERVSTWKVTVIHSLESVGCLVLFGSSQLSKSNCQRSTWLPCASHMGYSVHTPNFWTSGDLVGTSALHVQLVRRTSQHWIVIWTLNSCYLQNCVITAFVVEFGWKQNKISMKFVWCHSSCQWWMVILFCHIKLFYWSFWVFAEKRFNHQSSHHVLLSIEFLKLQDLARFKV